MFLLKCLFNAYGIILEHDILATSDNGRPNDHLVPRYHPKTVVSRTINAKWSVTFWRRSQSSRLTALVYVGSVGFDVLNILLWRETATNARQKAMLLHYAGEAVFDLGEAVGIVQTDNFEQTKLKLTAYFTPRRNEEYEVFTFRQTQQKSGETLDQFHARLQQTSKNCNFQDKNREIKSQIIQKCSMPKIRDRLSEVNITLPQLLTNGRALEATVQQATIMSNAASNGTSVHAVSHDSQSFSSKQGDYGTPRFRASRVHGKHSSHRDHQGLVPDMTSHTTSSPRVNHRIG